MVAKETPLPKYCRIMQDITEAIRLGDLAEGMRAPSENDLIETYNVSNTTARRVHMELEQAGWVTRIKGKGTFVRSNPVVRSVDQILGFSRNMIQAGRKPSTRLLGAQVLKSGATVSVNHRRYHLRGPVCEIRRLRLADGIPMMVETRHVSRQLCPDIENRALEGSLYDIYEKGSGLRLMRTDQSLSAVVVDADRVGFTGVERQIPAFKVEGVTFIAKEVVLEIEESVYRGDMYRFSVCATE